MPPWQLPICAARFDVDDALLGRVYISWFLRYHVVASQWTPDGGLCDGCQARCGGGGVAAKLVGTAAPQRAAETTQTAELGAGPAATAFSNDVPRDLVARVRARSATLADARRAAKRHRRPGWIPTPSLAGNESSIIRS